MLFQIILLTFLGSIISLCGGLVLLLKKNWNKSSTLLLTSFAAGTLLATAFLDLFPEAVEHLEETGGGDVFAPALFGIVIFFILERTFVWFHHHHSTHGIKPTVWTITFGDAVHNFIDGVAIAAAFLINPVVGLTTAFAVAAHEIPQEIADFSILLANGLTKSKALLFNIASSITAIFGALAMYFFAETLEMHLGTIISFTAGMFSYIALSDLIPELHHSDSKKDTLPQLLAFAIGMFLVIIIKSFVGEAAHAI